MSVSSFILFARPSTYMTIYNGLQKAVSKIYHTMHNAIYKSEQPLPALINATVLPKEEISLQPAPLNLDRRQRFLYGAKGFFCIEGKKQYDEMSISRNVEKENNTQLVETGRKLEFELLCKTLNKFSVEQIKQLLKEIEAFDFQNAPANSLLLDPQLPYLAMNALEREYLDVKYGSLQVATILNFWAALQYHQNSKDLQTIPIFEEGKVNPLAEQLIKETLITRNRITNEPLTPFLEGGKFDAFIANMRKLPVSEQRFLLVPDIQSSNATESISQVIINTSSINVFSRVTHKGQKMRIIPSTGMMQAFLDAQYDEPVTIKPRLYLSTEMQIRECGLTNTRDMMMSFPDAALNSLNECFNENGFNFSTNNSQCPSKADGYDAPWYDFSYHDFYHAIIASAIGKTYRKAGIVAADALLEFAEKADPCDRKGLHQLAISLIDIEYVRFQHYARKENIPLSEIFWDTMNNQIIAHKSNWELQERSRTTGTPFLYEVFPISEQSRIEAFKVIYSAFVEEQKGPAELNKESFKAAQKSKIENTESDIEIAAKNAIQLAKNGLLKKGVKFPELSEQEMQYLKDSIRKEYITQPIFFVETNS